MISDTIVNPKQKVQKLGTSPGNKYINSMCMYVFMYMYACKKQIGISLYNYRIKIHIQTTLYT